MKLWKETLGLRAFGLMKIPLIFLVNPSVLRLTERECAVKIPLNRLTRNHLGSMYFGTLAIGADCSGGLLAMSLIRKTKKKISVVFKDFRAEFLLRPESDVTFLCEDGKLIEKMIQETLASGKRVHRTLHIVAFCEKKSPSTPVAKFDLTLSLKAKS